MPVQIHATPLHAESRVSVFGILQTVLLSVIFVFLAVAMYRYQIISPPGIAGRVNPANTGGYSEGLLFTGKSLEYYTELARGRNLFRMDSGMNDAVVKAPEVAQEAGILASQYVVMGIIFDKNPQAILKDLQTGKTFFVRKGQAFSSGTVNDIKRDSVILNVNGQSIELIKK